MIRLHRLKSTEDVGVFEVDDLVLEGVGRVEQGFSFSVKFDGVCGFVDAVSAEEGRLVMQFLSCHPHVLLVHVLDVVHSLLGDLEQERLQQVSS
jgi:hypothetical protein